MAHGVGFMDLSACLFLIVYGDWIGSYLTVLVGVALVGVAGV